MEVGNVEKSIRLFMDYGCSFVMGNDSAYVTYLYDAGFTPTQVVSLRLLLAAFFLVIFTVIKNKEHLAIRFHDTKYFIGTGIISIVFFNWCLFNAIQETSISIAAILLYTAPVFVTILSVVMFKEAMTVRKMIALPITLAGCLLVIGVFPLANETVSLYGIILGVAPAFFYGLYSIFAKSALKKIFTFNGYGIYLRFRLLIYNAV